MQNLVHGIKDKIVVITGASSGIGKATAVMLSERGAKVVLGARGLDRLEALDRRVHRVELTPKGRALNTREFGEHAAAMEDVADVLSKNERLTLLRLLKKLWKHAAETRK
jgi:NADP-dependent 3-hydroxy acid dehydrogenase YdfG